MRVPKSPSVPLRALASVALFCAIVLWLCVAMNLVLASDPLLLAKAGLELVCIAALTIGLWQVAFGASYQETMLWPLHTAKSACVASVIYFAMSFSVNYGELSAANAHPPSVEEMLDN